MLLFTDQLASLGKKTRWRWTEQRKRTSQPGTQPLTLSVNGLLCAVDFSFIPRDSHSEPRQVPVSTVVSCREWPVRSQWTKRKWSGADTGNCQDSRGCNSLQDQILTRKSQEASNPSCPGDLAARPQAMRQDTRVQGRLRFTGAPGN